MNNKSTKKAVIQNIRKDMADLGIGEIELFERISVKMDTDQFNPKEDESVWLQKRGDAPQVCEVYFDDIWMCDIYETDSHEQFRNKYLKGFERAYESGKLRLNRFLAMIADEREKQKETDALEAQKKVIADLPTTTPEEKIAKEIIKEIHKENSDKPATI